MTSKCYVLNLKGFECWQKKNTTKGSVYKRIIIEKDLNLYFDRISTPDGEVHYMDYITGRMVRIIEKRNHIIVKPINLSINKENIQKTRLDLIKQEIYDIINDHKALENYEKISEEFLYYNYYCKLLSRNQKTKQIPEEVVEEKIVKCANKVKRKVLN